MMALVPELIEIAKFPSLALGGLEAALTFDSKLQTA